MHLLLLLIIVAVIVLAIQGRNIGVGGILGTILKIVLALIIIKILLFVFVAKIIFVIQK